MAQTAGHPAVRIGLIDGPVPADHPGLDLTRIRTLRDDPALLVARNGFNSSVRRQRVRPARRRAVTPRVSRWSASKKRFRSSMGKSLLNATFAIRRKGLVEFDRSGEGRGFIAGRTEPLIRGYHLDGGSPSILTR